MSVSYTYQCEKVLRHKQSTFLKDQHHFLPSTHIHHCYLKEAKTKGKTSRKASTNSKTEKCRNTFRKFLIRNNALHYWHLSNIRKNTEHKSESTVSMIYVSMWKHQHENRKRRNVNMHLQILLEIYSVIIEITVTLGKLVAHETGDWICLHLLRKQWKTSFLCSDSINTHIQSRNKSSS